MARGCTMGDAIAIPMPKRNQATMQMRSRSVGLRVFMVDKYKKAI